ncbi:MAG: hypothetical protein KC636_06100 [Myxococcales bacterium]|nr:hypothetical protein [Myxococcales bacterium]
MRVGPRLLSLLSLGLAVAACGDDEVTTTATTTGGEVETTAGPTDATEGETTAGETTGTGLCEADAHCDDGNACTKDRCSADGSCRVEAVLSNECRPQIDVSYPPRAATIVGEPGVPVVTVTGTVTSGAGSVEKLLINDKEVKIDADGGFTYDHVAAPGGNTLDLVAEDIVGAKRRRVQSYLWSSEYRKPEVIGEQMVPDGLAFYLSQDALDDGDGGEPADDIATVLGIALANFDIAAVLDPNTPLTNSAGFDVYLTDMAFGSTRVGLEARDGGLFITATLEEIVGDLYFDCTNIGCELLGGDGTGGLSVVELSVSAETEIYVDAQGQVQVTAMNAMTNLKQDDVDIWSNNGWTNFLISIIEPFILGGVVSDISAALNEQIDTQLGPALAGALNTLEVNALFDLPSLGGGETIPVNLVTEFASADFHDGDAPPDPSPPQSGEIHQRGAGYFSKDATPYDNEGVPGRVGCGSTDELVALPRTAEVELGLADDMINQVLYGAWRGGLLEFEVPPELAGDGATVIVNEFNASGMLAPTASDCKTPGMLLAHIGDLRFDGDLVVFDKPMTFTAYTSLLVRLEIAADGSSVSVGIPEVLELRTELTANEDDMIDAEEFIAGQIEDVVADTIVEALGGGGLGGIELPQIDLSAQLGLPPNTASLTLTAEGVVRSPGTTVIEAHFQ